MQLDTPVNSLEEGPFADFSLWHLVLEYAGAQEVASLSQVRKFNLAPSNNSMQAIRTPNLRNEVLMIGIFASLFPSRFARVFATLSAM